MLKENNSFKISRWLFLRLLGLIYFIAFLSFYLQLQGLISSNGILPVDRFLEIIKISFDSSSYFYFPSLAWISHTDFFLKLLVIVGIFFSLLLIIGILESPILITLYILYLSIVTIGQTFMSFQWDMLLLETGFLAIFLGSISFLTRPSKIKQPSKIIIFLFWFLLFRLMFSSGIGKILSGDSAWRDFTALNFHYFTQPLPTPISWYIHQLSEWCHKISVGIMFLIEIIVPFLFFTPRKVRHIAGLVTILLQLVIMSTGNYTFFNLLAIALCLLLFDDEFLKKILPKKLKGFFIEKESAQDYSCLKSNYKIAAISTFAALIIFLGLIQLGVTTLGFRKLPSSLNKTISLISPFHIVNRYGLFTVMTTVRPEIIIEGSNDGKNWKEYEFKYKPGDIKRNLPIVAPHQPRLDWQMWFAALGDYRRNPWFVNFLHRLLEGSPEVLKLLERNPFSDKPPKYIKASVYRYGFTDYKMRKESGAIWQRAYIRPYLPVLNIE